MRERRYIERGRRERIWRDCGGRGYREREREKERKRENEGEREDM